MHDDVATVGERGLRAHAEVPVMQGGKLRWARCRRPAVTREIVRTAVTPFSASGGLKLLTGNLGRAVIKVSAVPDDRHVIEAPARVFSQPGSAARAPSRPASWIATSSPWCASRARAPTACPSCTS